MPLNTSYGPIGSGARPASDSGFIYERELTDSEREAVRAEFAARDAYLEERQPKIIAELAAERARADADAVARIEDAIRRELRELAISRPQASDIFAMRAQRIRFDLEDMLTRRTEDDASYLAQAEYAQAQKARAEEAA